MKIQRSQTDLWHKFEEVFAILKSANTRYDEGEKYQIKVAASAIRALVHDKGSNVSILQQLGLKGTIKFFATPSPYNSNNNLLSENHLVCMRLSTSPDNSGYFPFLDDFPPISPWQRVSFAEWWEQKIIKDKFHRQITRGNLVLTICEQDGLAHVDPRLEPVYADFSRNNSLGWKSSHTINVFKEPEYPTLRQISHELQKTLENISQSLEEIAV